MSHAGLAVASAATSAVVAILAIVLTVVAERARRRTGNGNLGFVASAFLLFALRNLFSAYNVLTHAVPHDAIELVLSLFDLVIILLLVAPLARGRRAR